MTRLCLPALTALASLWIAQAAAAHFIWLRVEPAADSHDTRGSIRLFFNEEPHPEAGEFLKYVGDVSPTVAGVAVPVAEREAAREAVWAGRLPDTIDAERDLGVVARGGKPHRLIYTARAQTRPIDIATAEPRKGLRVRLVEQHGKGWVQVLFDGKPVAGARIKLYPADAPTREMKADEQGMADVAGLREGKVALWANWNDASQGDVEGTHYDEARHYATLTFQPLDTAAENIPTQFARLPEPAVNSFGGAVLGDWLYVYGGHLGDVHHYSTQTTSAHFRRLNLRDATTWEDLPPGKDLQGVALVSDGKSLYLTGGMSARNAADDDADMHSVADCRRFDPGAKTWTDLPAMPTPRSTHDAAIVGRTLYVVGGWTMHGASADSEFCTSMLALDLDHPERGWRTIEQPFERRALAVAEAGGKLFAIGGLIGGGMQVARRVDVYDPATGAWGRGPDFPGTHRNDGFAPSAFQVANRLYATGGSGLLVRLNSNGDAWEAVGALWQPRITHRLLPGPGRSLLAVGGNHNGQQTPVIERLNVPGED